VPDVYVLGVASTPLRKWPDHDFRDLAGEAARGAIADAGVEGAAPVEKVTFGDCAMGVWGQANIRGQVALVDLARDGVLPERAPIDLMWSAGLSSSITPLHRSILVAASISPGPAPPLVARPRQ
jgi:acetyl-CoA acetyltransferase